MPGIGARRQDSALSRLELSLRSRPWPCHAAEQLLFAGNARFNRCAEGVTKVLYLFFMPVRRIEIASVFRPQLGANASPLFLGSSERPPIGQSTAFAANWNSHVDVAFAGNSICDIKDRGRGIFVPCVSIQTAV